MILKAQMQTVGTRRLVRLWPVRVINYGRWCWLCGWYWWWLQSNRCFKGQGGRLNGAQSDY